MRTILTLACLAVLTVCAVGVARVARADPTYTPPPAGAPPVPSGICGAGFC